MIIESPRIVSLRVGRPMTMGTSGAADPDERPWTSGIFKEAVGGPVWLSKEGFEGDAVADTKNHGGPDQAVLGYSAEHYPAWHAELGSPMPGYGAFGENLTISWLDEERVCIGDIYEIGESRMQVSLPRTPCWKLARRLRIPRIIERVHESARGGWYMRVLREGRVECGQVMALEDRPHPEWTVARAYRVYHERARNRAEALDLADCPALARHWKARLLAEE